MKLTIGAPLNTMLLEMSAGRRIHRCVHLHRVRTRQALVISVVRPEERTAAAAITQTARTTVRPVGPMLGGLL